MAKILKITGRSLGLLVEWTILLLILAAFLIRTSVVQTYLAEKAAAYLSKELKAKVSVGAVDIVFIDRLAIDDVLIHDQEGDTLIYAGHLFATFDDISLARKKFIVHTAEVDHAYVHIKRDKDGNSNHSFLRDYFVKDKRKKNTIFYNVKSVSISNSRFQYDDSRKEKRDYGIDYWHIDAYNINGSASNIQINKNVITGQITNMAAKEKSGFELKSIQTFATVSPSGIKLQDVILESKKSTIEAKKFDMLSKSYTAFKYFVDSVSFDGRIDKSSIALDEAALFGYALRGMNDHVTFSGGLYRKVKDLKIKNFDLRYAKNTRVKGTINLTDYRDFLKGFFHEKLDYAHIDFAEIEKLRLPDSAPQRHLSFNERVKRLVYVEAMGVRLDGFKHQFVVAADQVNTNLGSASFSNGIMFSENTKNESYLFTKSQSGNYDVQLNSLNLGALMANKDIGTVTGNFVLSGEAFDFDDIEFYEISGDVSKFVYLDYPYKNIIIADGSYVDQVFEGKIDIKDDYLDLVYNGKIDFKGKQHMVFSIDLADAFLDNINISTKDSRMRSMFTVDLIGKNTNDMMGSVRMDGFVYTANGKEISVPSITMHVTRGNSFDRFDIQSSIGTALIEGKIDFNHLIDNFKYQFSKIFPALATENSLKNYRGYEDHFTFELNFKESDDFFAVFVPDLRIAPDSRLTGHFYGEESHFVTNFKADSFSYAGYRFDGIKVDQVMDSNSVSGTYNAKRFEYNDSLVFNDIFFTTNGGNNELTHNLSWGGAANMESLISWNTSINDWNHYSFFLEPSHFFLKDHRWDIAHESRVSVNSDTLTVDHFELTRGDQFITVEGKISNQSRHHLNYRIEDLEISEISGFITSDYPMEGKLNAWGYIAQPFNKLEYIADASLINFYVNNNEVGDVFVQSEYDRIKESISARGDLIYKGNQTFDFDGDYYYKKEKNNLDFDLFFDYTDIQFTNAFIDPDVMSEIRGILNGTVYLTGTPTKPILDGIVELQGASTYIDLLGVHFGVDGPIEIDEYGFYMNNIPVFDEEGNAGSLIGSVYHDNFRDFNFDLQFDLERDAINKDPSNPYKVVYLDKFLLMEDEYSPENLYYGKGYVTGEANIFGYTDNLEITVNVATQKGTWVNIPMYGVGEIDDEMDFIVFRDKYGDTIADVLEPKFDFTGVDLDLNFKVTPDADIKIIFNEDLGDIISAKGTGDINIKLDNLGEVRMDGIYTVQDGMYDFAMGPIKQKFFIENGGTINWTGDPYDANLNLKTYYKVVTNIADISQDQFASGTGAHQQVYCYLNLNESLLKPEIKFDIQAPQANDVARQLITRVTKDEDELNRQFFSLLLWKRFQPLAANVYSDGSAAADLITNQINSMLSKVSDDYKLNVAYANDQLTGDTQYEFGVSKGFLDDRLILSGSFGVENYQNTDDQNQSELIGDINLEYLLNEDGTFRVNIFNESTDKTVIQQADLGRFTQGAGLSYKEDYNKFSDFKAAQYFLDVFRKKENKRYPIKRKNQQRPVPQDSPTPNTPENQGAIEED